METIPEKIEGIPTAKNLSKERVGLIRKYYFNLWKKLQRSGRGNKIFCNYLGVDVFIVESESDKKTIFAASKNWQSTYAVKHYQFTNEEIPYLNFMAKLTIGIKADGKHVQYCVNKVECSQ